ncbi:MAG: ribonuclease P protein component [Candidatus Hydrogenedentes bacterium]|nr:ribonuclease P protein component [Candidatus Hydrogenedentota bacterium]
MPGRQRLPRTERLTRKCDFEWVYQHGTKRVGPHFLCYMARREGQGRKVGFAVSRKVGKATVRNRVKRLIREVYRRHRSELAGDLCLVVIARSSSRELSFEECSAAIRRLWSQGGVLHG